MTACAKDAAPPHPAPPSPIVTDASSPGAPVVTAPAPDAAHVALPADLPPFGKTAKSDPKTAAELAHKAIRMDSDSPVADATAAVKADPGSAYARYALACVANDEAFATKQLELLVAGDGDELRNVLIDSDCPWTAAHKALADKAKPSSQREAVETLAKALVGPDRSAAKPFFAGGAVTSRFACSNCSDTTHDRRSSGTGAKVLADVTKILEQDDKDTVPLVIDRMRRDHDCFVADRSLLHHNHTFLDKICFAPGTTKVKSIELIDG
ncbi:MAG TPA: hypothetical protein VGO00_07130 [Kofleriaceae bacterium]|nr:hypothetical protein [Kofleriaceae bacterium]